MISNKVGGDKMENRVKFKIGEIEFEAVGSEEVIERERNVFLMTLLPAAVDALVRTRGGSIQKTQYLEEPEEFKVLSPLPPTSIDDINNRLNVDFSKTSLASFLKDYGTLNEQDFTLISIYFDENKNDALTFSSESIKSYYAEARRPEYSNISVLLTRLAKNGYIMDAPNSEENTLKQYKLTSYGLSYIESYQPKKIDKEKRIISKPKKSRTKIESEFAKLNADNLCLKKYPSIKDQDSFIKKMLLVLYIVSEGNHGNEFLVADVKYLMTDILGLPATTRQVQGVFDRNKSWFKKESDLINKKAYKYRLLEGAKDFARSIVNG